MQRWLSAEGPLVVVVGRPGPPFDGPQTAQFSDARQIHFMGARDPSRPDMRTRHSAGEARTAGGESQ
jgi:hypothetical protein